MDATVQRKLEEKFLTIISNKNDIKNLADAFSQLDCSKPFSLGIIVGRIYNSFFYQSKRILNREPTDEEFKEFLVFLNTKKSDLESLW